MKKLFPVLKRFEVTRDYATAAQYAEESLRQVRKELDRLRRHVQGRWVWKPLGPELLFCVKPGNTPECALSDVLAAMRTLVHNRHRQPKIDREAEVRRRRSAKARWRYTFSR